MDQSEIINSLLKLLSGIGTFIFAGKDKGTYTGKQFQQTVDYFTLIHRLPPFLRVVFSKTLQKKI